jgi:hypothetical protein
LEAISVGLVEKFKVSRSAIITGAGTNRDMAALRLMLNYAKRQQYIDRNPVCDVSFLDHRPGSSQGGEGCRHPPGFRLYDFRHTFGSSSAMAGVDLPTLKELMGHTSIATTMGYVRPTPEHKRQAMAMLEQFNTKHVFALYQNGESLQNPLQ